MSFFVYRHSRSGFTLVELIVGMTIFAIGLTGILALLGTTISNSSYSRHEIVVAGLLREQMELVKNIRDTNIANYTEWDKVFVENTATTSWSSGVYIIENNFQDSEFSFGGPPFGVAGSVRTSPVFLESITTPFQTLDTDENRFDTARLFLDAHGRYTHDDAGNPTSYASYLIVSPLGYDSAGTFVPVIKYGKNQGYVIDARVIVKNGNNYREYDAKTLITDWVK